MKKVVITAFDITTAKRAGQTSLAVPENALVTPQAADDARDYGIALVVAQVSGEPAPASRPIAAHTGAGTALSRESQGGVVLVSAASLPLRHAPSSNGVAMVEGMLPSSAAPGVAYMAWENTSFFWKFVQAELLVVLEGEITVTANGSARTGKPGDTFVIPAGTEATLAATGKARCMHSSWPTTPA